MPPKKKPPIKNSKISKDTPAPERYARVIAEDFDSKLDLILENMSTIEKKIKSELSDFKEDVMEAFAKVDMRFLVVDQRFDKVDQRLDKVEQKLNNVDLELKETRGDLANLAEKVDQVLEKTIILDHEVEELKSAM